MSSLNKSLARQTDLQEKLADGKAIHTPSDDPVRAVRSLRFNISLRGNEQYTQHVKDAISWMESTDSAMSDLSSILIKAKELVTQAVAPNPDMALEAIGQELDGLINQMVEIGNTKIGDRYIFAGQNDKTQPFQRRMVDPGAVGGGDAFEAVVYSGDSNKISMRIQAGGITPTQDSVSLSGDEVFGPLSYVTEAGIPASTGPTQVSSMFQSLLWAKQVLNGKAPVTQSNPLGATANLTAPATMTTHKAATLRIDQLTGTTPNTISYTVDGGQNWISLTEDTPGSGQFTIPGSVLGTEPDDVTYTFGADADTVVGDTYSVPAVSTTTGTADLQWLSTVGLQLVDNAHDYILQSQTEIGARMSMYEQAEALLEKNNVIITGDVSANEDLDIAQAMIDFKTSESVYRTALSVGAKIMPQSLADFLN
ncbi:MAG: flagellar hook-associated protein 3 [Firmicutes bacterium]|nr:flagellar hook-associated protein 3 [Bacillota bacterium]